MKEDLINTHLNNSTIFYMKLFDQWKKKVDGIEDSKSKNATLLLHYFSKHYFKLYRNDVEYEKNLVKNMVEEFISLNIGGGTSKPDSPSNKRKGEKKTSKNLKKGKSTNKMSKNTQNSEGDLGSTGKVMSDDFESAAA